MRQHRGKWLLLLLLPIWLFAAQVEISVNKQEVVVGDRVTFTITADGYDVTFPWVDEIDGFPIIEQVEHTNMTIVNGDFHKSLSKSYTFEPTHDVTIPPFTVEVDGQTLKTKPLKIKVVQSSKPSASQGSGVKLLLKVNKHDVMVGEPIRLDLIIKYRADAGFVKYDPQPIEFPNFWVKPFGKVEDGVDGAYRTKTHHYLLFPQKGGNFKIGPVTVKFAKRTQSPQTPFANDPFFNDFFTTVEWRRYASNGIDIHVNPLPAGLELFGDFKLSVSVDKEEVEANQPVRLTIRIEGKGNIDDIQKFQPNIPNAVVYADEPVIKSRLINGDYGGLFTQTITIIADQDYTIPPLHLRYVDARTKQVVEKESQPIPIHVKGSQPVTATQEHPITSKEVVEGPSSDGTIKEHPSPLSPSSDSLSSSSDAWGWILLLGIVIGSVATWSILHYRPQFPNISHLSHPRARAVRRAKDDKRLFELLLPYTKADPTIASAVQQLEENLFQGKQHRVDRKLLAEIVEMIEEDKKGA